MLKYINDVYEKLCVTGKCDLKDLIVCCCWDLNYANVDLWIDVLNCL
jgi:hypothetical protein